MKRFCSLVAAAAILIMSATFAVAAVTPAMTNQAKLDAMTTMAGHTLKIALYTQAAATLSGSTTVYTTTGELATANGYTQGGATLASCAASLSGSKAQITCANPTWTATGAGFTADAAIVYDTTASNHVLGVYTFTSTTASGGGTFTITIPADLLYIQ